MPPFYRGSRCRPGGAGGNDRQEYPILCDTIRLAGAGLNLTNVQAADAGDHTVTVTNAPGSMTRAPATPAVTAAPGPPAPSGGGGGGAISGWFVLVLALPGLERLRRSRPAR